MLGCGHMGIWDRKVERDPARPRNAAEILALLKERDKAKEELNRKLIVPGEKWGMQAYEDASFGD